MGLEERRKIKELQDITIPERTAELAEITGGAISYHIDWDSFADDLEGLNFMDNLACHRINMALRVICSDDLGKEAVVDAVKSIALRNTKDASDRSMSLEGGTFAMQYPFAMRTDAYFSDGEIREFLLQKL